MGLHHSWEWIQAGSIYCGRSLEQAGTKRCVLLIWGEAMVWLNKAWVSRWLHCIPEGAMVAITKGSDKNIKGLFWTTWCREELELEIILDEEVSGKSCSERAFGRVLKQASFVRISTPHIWEWYFQGTSKLGSIQGKGSWKSLNIMPLRPRAPVVFSWCGNT